MSAYATDINDEFGVGFDFDPAEAAFPSPESMPQFLPVAPAKTPASVNLYPPMLLMDLALGLDDSDTICARHGLTAEQLEKLFALAPFKQQLSAMIKDLRESNKIFKVQAGVVAERALARVDEVIHDGETPAKDVIAGAKLVIEAADLMPKPEKSDGQSAQQQVNIQINIPQYT